LIAANKRGELYESSTYQFTASKELCAFEFEADRQAVQWSAAAYERLLGTNGCGMHVHFPHVHAAWDLFGLALTLSCEVIQGRSQPDVGFGYLAANVRSSMIQTFMDEHLGLAGWSDEDRAQLAEMSAHSQTGFVKGLGLCRARPPDWMRRCRDAAAESQGLLDSMRLGAFRKRTVAQA
jgi:hypothetical protein